MTLIDTHCHLDLPVFDADRKQILDDCQSTGVSDIVVPGVQKSSWSTLIELCNRHNQLHLALGLHPMFTEQHCDDDLTTLVEQLEQNNVVAIGEIGLDFHDKTADVVTQSKLFEAQLKIAADHRLPVILHVRKAHDQVLQLLKKNPVDGGICHAFNGSIQQAYKYIEAGFKLGFGGMLTYERSSKLRKLAETLPLSSLVLETDAPDMSPVAHHGERNSPVYLPEIATALALTRGITLAEVATQTSKNAGDIFSRAVFQQPASLQDG